MNPDIYNNPSPDLKHPWGWDKDSYKPPAGQPSGVPWYQWKPPSDPATGFGPQWNSATWGTPQEPKKDDPKKDDPKKDDPKKDDPKKEDIKKEDTKKEEAKQTGQTSQPTQPAQVAKVQVAKVQQPAQGNSNTNPTQAEQQANDRKKNEADQEKSRQQQEKNKQDEADRNERERTKAKAESDRPLLFPPDKVNHQKRTDDPTTPVCGSANLAMYSDGIKTRIRECIDGFYVMAGPEYEPDRIIQVVGAGRACCMLPNEHGVNKTYVMIQGSEWAGATWNDLGWFTEKVLNACPGTETHTSGRVFAYPSGPVANPEAQWNLQVHVGEF